MSFWGYALETAATLLNLAPSKFVSKIFMELWLGCKLSLNHIHIWGCLANVLKGKIDKFESKIKVSLFVRYPKGTNGYLF
jgi:hypothetical protein